MTPRPLEDVTWRARGSLRSRFPLMTNMYSSPGLAPRTSPDQTPVVPSCFNGSRRLSHLLKEPVTATLLALGAQTRNVVPFGLPPGSFSTMAPSWPGNRLDCAARGERPRKTNRHQTGGRGRQPGMRAPLQHPILFTWGGLEGKCFPCGRGQFPLPLCVRHGFPANDRPAYLRSRTEHRRPLPVGRRGLCAAAGDGNEGGRRRIRGPDLPRAV